MDSHRFNISYTYFQQMTEKQCLYGKHTKNEAVLVTAVVQFLSLSYCVLFFYLLFYLLHFLLLSSFYMFILINYNLLLHARDVKA